MNLNVYDELFSLFKEYINTNSKVAVTVLKKPNTTDFPKIICKEITNKDINNSMHFMNSYSMVGYEFDIYAKGMKIDGEFNDGTQIVRYLSGLVDDFIKSSTSMTRTMGDITPNFDETVDRMTLRYNGSISDYRGCFL